MGAPELLILLLVAALVGTTWALVDVCMRPADAFRAAGQNKTLWLVGILAAWVVALGWLVGWVYVIAIRPKVARAQVTGGVRV